MFYSKTELSFKYFSLSRHSENSNPTRVTYLVRPCHSSGGWPPVSHHEDPGPIPVHSMWGLWVFSECFGFPLPFIFLPMLHTHPSSGNQYNWPTWAQSTISPFSFHYYIHSSVFLYTFGLNNYNGVLKPSKTVGKTDINVYILINPESCRFHVVLAYSWVNWRCSCWV